MTVLPDNGRSVSRSRTTTRTFRSMTSRSAWSSPLSGTSMRFSARPSPVTAMST
jgi:hypothetical protein